MRWKMYTRPEKKKDWSLYIFNGVHIHNLIEINFFISMRFFLALAKDRTAKWNKFSEFRFDQFNNDEKEEEKTHQIYGFNLKMREMIKKRANSVPSMHLSRVIFWPCDLRFFSVDFVRMFFFLLLLFTEARWTNFVTLNSPCSIYSQQTYIQLYKFTIQYIREQSQRIWAIWNDVSSVLNRKISICANQNENEIVYIS